MNDKDDTNSKHGSVESAPSPRRRRTVRRPHGKFSWHGGELYANSLL